MGVELAYVQRASSGRLSYRRIFPEHLRAFIPGNPTQLRRSLRTSSPHSPGAIEIYRDADAEFERTVALAAKAASGSFDPLDDPLIAYLSEAYRVESLQQDDLSRWDEEERELYTSIKQQLAPLGIKGQFEGKEGSRWAIKRRETLEAAEARYRDILGSGDTDAAVSLMAEELSDFAQSKGYRLETSSPAFRKLCQNVTRTSLSAIQLMLARLDGEDIPTPPEPTPRPDGRTPPVLRHESREGGEETFGQIVERLIASPLRLVSRHMAPSTRLAFRHFKEVHGDLRPSEITRKQVSEWLEMLTRKPSKYPHKERMLPLPELVSRYANSPEVPRQRGKTIEILLIALSSIWNKGQQQGDIDEALKNPFQGRSLPSARTPSARKGFNVEELNAIFALPVFTQGERPARGRGEASYWIPLLMLFTGARPEEVAQLLVSDVGIDPATGAATLTITNEEAHPAKGQRTLKTEKHDTGRRTFPIPVRLIELGFLDYVEWLRNQTNGAGALFPLLTAKVSRGLLFDAFGDFWRLYLNEQGVIKTGTGRSPAKEFRHAWTTEARRIRMPEDAREYLQGHSVAGKSANVGYGERETFGSEMLKIEFPGLDLGRVRRWRAPDTI